MRYHYVTSTTGNYDLLKEKAKGMRDNPTLAECILWEHLRRKGLGERFRRQHPIGNYIVDFVCLPKWLVIEVDGSVHKQKEHKQEDKERTKFLNEMGFQVLRFTNDEVESDTKTVIRKIKEYMTPNGQAAATKGHPSLGETC